MKTPLRLAAFAAGLTLAIAAPAHAQEITGPQTSPFGICAHVPTDATLDRLAAAGIRWVRYDFNWVQLEPQKGQFDWGFMDRAVASARSRGLFIFATLAYSPPWANGGRHHSAPATDPRDWTDFVRAAVGRYRNDIRHWGMWNEPNLGDFFSGTRAQYIDEILIPGADAAKAVDPGCFVLGPELSDLNSGKWWEWLEEVLVRAGDRIDIVSHHIYDKDASVVQEELDGRPLTKQSFKYVMDRFGQGQEVWLTETGWDTTSDGEPHQAAEYPKLLGGVLARSYLGKVFFYEATDDPNIAANWGIIRADGSPKPSYAEYAAVVNANPGAGHFLRFEAERDFQHQTGAAVAGGWQASAGRDAPGHLLFGPYTTLVPPGDRTAAFTLSIDATAPGDDLVATIDVHDATASRVIVERQLKRSDFHGTSPNRFYLNFQRPAGAQLELRVRWEGAGTLTADRVEILPGRDIRGQRGLTNPCAALPLREATGANLLLLAGLAAGLILLRRRSPKGA